MSSLGALSRVAFVLGMLGLFNFAVVGCSSTSKTASVSLPPEMTSDLSKEEAIDRHERVSQVKYDLTVDLIAGASKEKDARYAGELEIRFQLKNATRNLRLDFFEGEVVSLLANGKPVPASQKKKYWIDLPAASLVEGANTLKISYTQAYSRAGEGLHRFIDPADGRIYLHTHFEPYDANRFLPCFDQPDLRSVLTLKVKAPKSWVVVTGGHEIKTTLTGDARVWEFAATPEISTYLFSLYAGSYAMVKDVYVRADKSQVPLRLYVRESLKKYLKHKDWFKNTKDGLAYFENYFGVRYPFSKLDQLVAPEFNAGGMENVAAITYTEWMLPRSAVTRKNRRELASLQLHEIAHMWFGDLVTMKWWNDLWLNESFATYMASLSLAEATEFKESWQTFAASTKSRAYVEDVMVTTHPIEASITRVKEAITNFDAITYNKGASVLKQLNYYMTSDDFRSGVREYFKTYAYQNTTLAQFIGSLQTKTKKDLGRWADRWLRQSGPDLVSASWSCDKDRLKSVDVRLTTAPGRLARPQSVEIGFYKTNGGKLLTANRLRADFEGEGADQTVQLKGDWACPDFVYPNHADHGYVLVKLDATSLGFLASGLSKIDDLMTRTQVWNDLWRMVRETEISLKTYVDIVAKNFSAEKDEVILQQVLSTILSPRGSILSYWPTESSSKAERAKFVLQMEQEFLKRLGASVSGSDEEKIWYGAYVGLAETPSALDQLYKWYMAGRVSKNFPLDLDRAWGISGQLSRYRHPKAASVVAEMKKKDPTDRGAKSAMAAEASIPSSDVKQKWVQEFTKTAPNAMKFSLEELRAVSFSLFPLEQQELKLGFSKDFFGYLEKHRSSEEQSRVGTVLASLVPLVCENAESSRLKEKVNQYSDINPSFKKRFLMGLDEDERCQRIRARSSL